VDTTEAQQAVVGKWQDRKEEKNEMSFERAWKRRTVEGGFRV